MAIGRYVQHDFIRANLRIPLPVSKPYILFFYFSSVGYSEARLKEVVRCAYENVNIHSKSGLANSKGGA